MAEGNPFDTQSVKPGGRVRFAVIGCGHIGKRHIEMIQRNPDAELVAICDLLPLNQLGFDSNTVHLAPSVRYFSSLEALLSSGIDFEVLNVCTPNGMHASMAVQALKTGRHLVIEKPMALHTADAKSIVETAQQKDKLVFCVMQNRYSPPSVWIKDLVESGKLGKIYLVQINCYWNRDERYYTPEGWHGTKDMDGGTLFTQFSHFIDLMYWLFGDITNIQARLFDFNHQTMTAFEDTGIVSFDFIGGGIGSVNYSTSVWDKNQESSITIVAENGSVKIGGQYMNEVEYCHVKDYTMPQLAPTNPGNDYGAYKGSAQNHHLVIQNVVDVLSGKVTEITTNVLDGFKVVDIIQRIYAATQK